MNILLIIADALRSDRLHCYGYPKNTSPNIDRLAKEGILFKNVISNCNHTLPGIVSLLTGLYQTSHRLDGPKNYQRWKNQKNRNNKTVLNILHENKYRLIGINIDFCSPLGIEIQSKDIPSLLEENKIKKFFIAYRSEETHLPYNPASPYDTMFLPRDYCVDEETIKKLEIVKTKLLIHRPGLLSRLETGAIDPIQKPGHTRTVGEVVFFKTEKPAVDALYDGEVRTLDNEIGMYRQKLEDLDILNDTIVVLTADHGEQLLERNALGHSSCSLEGNLFDENIKIPLIIRYPRIPADKIIETQISQVDIMPTLFDILGLKLPDDTDGQSLLPLIKGKAMNFEEEAYAMTQPSGWQVIEGDERMIYCIRTPEWKLIYCRYNNVNSHYELYNLKDDPGEKKDIFRQNSEIEQVLKEKLIQWISKGKRKIPWEVMNES